MTVHGFLTKENGRYTLAPDSAVFLDRRSPAYMGAMANFLVAPMHKQSFSNLAQSVRKGGSANELADNSKPHDEFWTEFARSMAGLATPSADVHRWPHRRPKASR